MSLFPHGNMSTTRDHVGDHFSITSAAPLLLSHDLFVTYWNGIWKHATPAEETHTKKNVSILLLLFSI